MESEATPGYVRLTSPGFMAPPGTWNPAECPILYTINGIRPRDHTDALRLAGLQEPTDADV